MSFPEGTWLFSLDPKVWGPLQRLCPKPRIPLLITNSLSLTRPLYVCEFLFFAVTFFLDDELDLLDIVRQSADTPLIVNFSLRA